MHHDHKSVTQHDNSIIFILKTVINNVVAGNNSYNVHFSSLNVTDLVYLNSSSTAIKWPSIDHFKAMFHDDQHYGS